MTYPPFPVNQPTFVVITCIGLVALLAAALVGFLEPPEGSPSVLAVHAGDVNTTGSVVQSGGGAREWTDPVRPQTVAHDVLLTPASD